MRYINVKSFMVLLFWSSILSCSPKPRGLEVEVPGQGGSDIVDNNNSASGIKSPNRCELIASPQVTTPGNTVTIYVYTFGDVIAATVDNLNIDPKTLPQGSITVTPEATRKYTGVATTSKGEKLNCEVEVTVNADTSTAPTPGTPGANPPATTTPSTPAPTCQITADKTSITSGEAVVLRISTSGNPTSTSLDGSPAQNGSSKFVSPTSSRTYTGNVSNAGGSNSCSVNISVTGGGSTGGGTTGTGISVPQVRTLTKRCTIYAPRLGQGSCSITCPSGWRIFDWGIQPHSKYGQNCRPAASAAPGPAGVALFYGQNRSTFTGTREVCYAYVTCEGY